LEREVQEPREDQRESPAPSREGLPEDPRGVREPLWKKLFPKREAQEAADWAPRPTGPPESHAPETTASEPAEGQPEDEKPKRGIWLPHPDDVRDRRNFRKDRGD
jgi:hypothetical protein